MKTNKKRALKFRVWDNEENKFFEPIYEAYKGNLLDLNIGLSGDLCRRTLEYCSEHESRFPGRYEIQQYTGLKDKNGNEIYEGDIIKCLHPKFLYQENPEYDEHLHIVRWDDKEARFTDGHSNFGGGGEVVGNIYENKEILNQ